MSYFQFCHIFNFVQFSLFFPILGVGKTAPDPNEKTELDGIEVPYGKGTKQEGIEKTDLLYNEYIVYDVAQIHCKYLFKVKFNYKF